MPRVLWLFCCLPLALSAAAEPGEATLHVEVTGVEEDRGVVIIALLDSEESYDSEDRAARSANVTPAGGRATASFEGLPFGTYAIKVVHDANNNGRLDTNFVGIPKEPFGFSNDAMGRFGPPGFDDASFAVEGVEVKQTIELVEF